MIVTLAVFGPNGSPGLNVIVDVFAIAQVILPVKVTGGVVLWGPTEALAAPALTATVPRVMTSSESARMDLRITLCSPLLATCTHGPSATGWNHVCSRF